MNMWQQWWFNNSRMWDRNNKQQNQHDRQWFSVKGRQHDSVRYMVHTNWYKPQRRKSETWTEIVSFFHQTFYSPVINCTNNNKKHLTARKSKHIKFHFDFVFWSGWKFLASGNSDTTEGNRKWANFTWFSWLMYIFILYAHLLHGGHPYNLHESDLSFWQPLK